MSETQCTWNSELFEVDRQQVTTRGLTKLLGTQRSPAFFEPKRRPRRQITSSPCTKTIKKPGFSIARETRHTLDESTSCCEISASYCN